MIYADITLQCFCKKEFIWTAGEQSFIQVLFERGKIRAIHKPRRCPECRAKRKAEEADGFKFRNG